MCYHYSSYLTAKQIRDRFGLKQPETAQPTLFEPVHHVSGFIHPKMPVVYHDGRGGVLDFFYWGLIPRWSKNEEFAQSIRSKTLNARAESITEKPSFRSAVATNRCLVPATGFFEWHTSAAKQKVPHYIYLKEQQPFAFAGIYDEWLNHATGELINSYSIVTTAANPMMAHIHNSKGRMPVILPAANEKLWIDPEIPLRDALTLLQPFDEQQMAAHTISTLITRRGADTNVPAVYAPQAWESGELF